MLTLIGRLARWFKKDVQLLVNYEKTHPHFFWYLGVDALLSVVLVFGGYSLYADMTSDPHSLEHVGAEALTSEELVEHAHENKVLAYWLGAFPEYEYTMNHANPDVADILYWKKGTQEHGTKLFIYEVKTYRNQKAWDARTHSMLATTNTETIKVSKDLTIWINPTSMRGAIAAFRGRPEIVALAYPKPQRLQDMVKNVESLRQVQ